MNAELIGSIVRVTMLLTGAGLMAVGYLVWRKGRRAEIAARAAGAAQDESSERMQLLREAGL